MAEIFHECAIGGNNYWYTLRHWEESLAELAGYVWMVPKLELVSRQPCDETHSIIHRAVEVSQELIHPKGPE